MPKPLENKLQAEAQAKGLQGDKADAYVYGTMRKTGWKPDEGLMSPERGNNPLNGRSKGPTTPVGQAFQKVPFNG